MAVLIKDANGNHSELAPSSVGIGIGVTQVGKEFEVAGNLISRTSEAGGTAIAMASEEDGLGSIWTNRSYNPAEPFSRWKRTINLKNGNVGIGGSNDAEALAPAERLVVAGNIVATGDIRLSGADCAEEFQMEEGRNPEPGTVMVISDAEILSPCTDAYDTRVAGVLSGAGNCKPGIILGKQSSDPHRVPLALNGKVYCKVDAGYAPVRVGDLLTTSPTPGHAMKAIEPLRCFGAVLGKALQPLVEGRGLIPVLVALH